MKTSINNDTAINNDTNITLVLTPDEFFFLKQCVNDVDPARHGLLRDEVAKINNQFNNLSMSLFAAMGMV